MSCNCECDCTGAATVTSIIAGIILGILYYFGFIATGVIFWAYFAFGLLAVLFAPIYGFLSKRYSDNSCYCRYRNILNISAIGTIISAVVGLITVSVASTITVTIVIAIATFFAVLLIGSLVCLTKCICEN